ncbi:MerR family transcriptional regulator [Sediminibacillus halophilus]|uniref:DNA-binding transcriptional regulator, MerR family n=1 Tax=Sediminibacillus halophilus TaxID=482461 RepID=A0A1G9TFR2_9BACI|nr:MerR family transcriptional regulator [Sediminibacillus halophilus]SDM46581.1 DNA-binding transcriptional regulator, MerR family [Sediminibacillus halophilus]
MGMTVKQVADLVGISVRTLHHYDEIGLLTPADISSGGYRLYSDEDLEQLQQILFYKELGFPLKRIGEMMHAPSFDRQEALELQYSMLLEKRRRLDNMIALVEQTIQSAKGEIEMTNEEKFAGFDFSRNPYEQEARDRWGDKAVDDSNQKIGNMTKEEQQALGEDMNKIYRSLAGLRHQDPASDEAQAAIGEWFRLLNKMGNYSLDAFKGLGQMYVDDERFTKNIDQFGSGLAKFMRNAMAVFADNRQ